MLDFFRPKALITPSGQPASAAADAPPAWSTEGVKANLGDAAPCVHCITESLGSFNVQKDCFGLRASIA